jgi:hypothetical protein
MRTDWETNVTKEIIDFHKTSKFLPTLSPRPSRHAQGQLYSLFFGGGALSVIVQASSDTFLVWQKDVMAENPVWCRAISFMDKLSSSAVYSCLLLESIFLHRLIAAAFKGDPKMLFYYLGAAGKRLFLSVYVIAVEKNAQRLRKTRHINIS